MAALTDLIRTDIAREGSIPFRRFMELALYHPEYGYYRRDRARPRTGRTGDFVTSVSVGPLFGRLLARQFLEMWERLERPAMFRIVEQGAEDARLAADILAWCRDEAPAFFAAVRYGLIEEAGTRRAAQEATLKAPGLAGKAGWLAAPEEVAPLEGVFFSNELVDAFPVHRVVCRSGAWLEQHVVLDGRGDFAWSEAPPREPAVVEAARALPVLEGCVTELNLRAREWMARVARSLGRGYVVTIDYGFPASTYYAPFRCDGTLSAYRQQQRAESILTDPGEQDLTAHVDFTALARAGEGAGLVTLGFLDQARFLTGIAHGELAGAAGPRTGVAENLRAWQTLTHPAYFGARFHALLQAKDAPGDLAGLRFVRPGALE